MYFLNLRCQSLKQLTIKLLSIVEVFLPEIEHMMSNVFQMSVFYIFSYHAQFYNMSKLIFNDVVYYESYLLVKNSC